jgi:hypothetical protein
MGNTIAVKPVLESVATEPGYYFLPGTIPYSQKPRAKINRAKVVPKKN